MHQYMFDLLVDGFDVENDAHIEGLLTCDLEAYPSSDGLQTTITFVVPAESSVHALRDAVDALAMCVSGLTDVRVAADLVATSDIARRLDRSRESVRQLVTGESGPGGFPHPEAVVASGTKVWQWFDVYEWLLTHEYVEVSDPRPIAPDVSRSMALDLHLTRSLATQPNIRRLARLWGRERRADVHFSIPLYGEYVLRPPTPSSERDVPPEGDSSRPTLVG